MKNLLIVFIGVVGLSTGLSMLLKIGIERQIKHECAVWDSYAKEYPNFYWTKEQIDQCHPNTFPVNGVEVPYRNDAQKYNQYN